MWVVTQDYRHSATLFACHPPGSVAERIVVFLDLVDPTTLALVDPPRPTTTTSTVPGRLTTPRRALVALAGGLGVALALPPWGWWPLAFAGVAVFETGPRRSRRPRRQRAGLAFIFAFAWLATGMAWMWQLTAPGYVVASAVFAAVPRRRRSRRADRSVEHDRPAVRPHARRGAALLVAVRRRAPRQPGHRPGGRPVRRGRPRRRRRPAHLGRVPGRLSRSVCWLRRLRRRDRRRAPGRSPACSPPSPSSAISALAPRGHGTGVFLDIAAVQGGGEQGTSADDVPSAVVTAAPPRGDALDRAG